MKQPRKTPTKEQKDWMKSAGYTAAQLDALWNENVDTNPIIRNLNIHGMSWRDLNLSCVMQLPTQKERDLKILREKEDKERVEKAAEEQKKRDMAYYHEHFEDIMLKKLDSGEELTEKELEKIIFGFGVETDSGENRRWSRTNTTIVCLCGRYFSVDWEEGLTEYQENEFYNQPVEVVRRAYEKTITVTEWTPVKVEVRPCH